MNTEIQIKSIRLSGTKTPFDREIYFVVTSQGGQSASEVFQGVDPEKEVKIDWEARVGGSDHAADQGSTRDAIVIDVMESDAKARKGAKEMDRARQSKILREAVKRFAAGPYARVIDLITERAAKRLAANADDHLARCTIVRDGDELRISKDILTHVGVDLKIEVRRA